MNKRYIQFINELACTNAETKKAELGARDNATTRQCREAEKLSLVALSLIIRKLSRCRYRKEKLSLIFATTDKQTEKEY